MVGSGKPWIVTCSAVESRAEFSRVDRRASQTVATEIFGAVRVEHAKTQSLSVSRDHQESVRANSKSPFTRRNGELSEKILNVAPRSRENVFLMKKNEIVPHRFDFTERNSLAHLSGSR